MKIRALRHAYVFLPFLFLSGISGQVQSSQHVLLHHVPAAVTSGQAKPLGQLPATQRMNLSIVLPLRNQTELNSLLNSLYDPSSPNYHHFLTVKEFADQFGPATDDYQKVLDFAGAHGFEVRGKSANRLTVSLTGSIAQVEEAFGVKMYRYQHPTEAREFFSPDREPSIPAGLSIMHIAGLDNYSLPKPQVRKPSQNQSANANSVLGSGPGGAYLSSDMRAAYYEGSSLTGAGQTVALVQFDGYDIKDVVGTFDGTATAANNGTDNIINYTPLAGGPTYSIPIHNVLLDGATGTAGQFTSPADDAEESLDIAQVIGMAPGLSQVRVYIGSSDADILSAIAADDDAEQVSISWYWGSPDPESDDIFFEELAAQGQSVFAASGDYGTFVPWEGSWPMESDYVTAVGGTSLTTSGAGGSWGSEVAWDRSGGGVSLDNIQIPDWQVLAINGTNGGSTTLRNVPDVAMEADFDNYVCDMGACGGGWAGTSFAAPRWAGFIALANQQAASAGNAPVGFVNPALYTIGERPNYDNTFHDIVSGNNNYWGLEPLPYFNAIPGYDLVTGWGSPAGQALIDALAPQAPAGFELSSSANALTIQPGSQGNSTISVVTENGFGGVVNLAVSGLPPGVTSSFSANPVAASSTLTLVVGSSAVRGTYDIEVTGTSGANRAAVSLTLNVDAPGFSILFSPPSVQIPMGATATVTASIIRNGGFTGDVNLAITSPIPNGLTATWSTNPTSETSELTLSTTSGTYASNLTITGTSGDLTASAPLGLDIVMPMFALDISPIRSSITQGTSSTATVTLVPNGALTSLVTLSAISLPTGVSATLNPTSLSAGQSSTLTLTADASAPIGTSRVCIGGSVQSYVTTNGECFAQTVTSAPVPTFALEVSQPTLTLAQGASATETVTVTPQNGFAGSIGFTVSGIPAGVTGVISPNPTTGSTVLTLRATPSAAPGLYQVNVVGTSGTQSTAAMIFLTVTAASSFSISPATASLTVAPGTSANETLSVIPHFGFSGSVNLSVVSSLPSGLSASFSPNPSSGGSTLTLTASGSTQPGNYIVSIAGTSGTETENATLFLTIGTTVGTGTTTTLSVSPTPGTSVPLGTVYTLTAIVSSASGLVTHGQVKFCDTSSASCTDTHLLGVAQLTSAGTAVLRYHPPAGNHTYAAVFEGTPASTPPYPGSSSSSVTLDALAPTITVISASGSTGNYALTAAIANFGSASAPSGNVSFVDSSDSNYLLASAPIESGPGSLSFSNLSNPGTGNSPSSVAIGDFNGDGNLDIAVTNQQDNTVTILLGNGDGTFAIASTVSTGSSPSSAVTGDFNNDGISDLAVVNSGENTVSILLGNGDGTFTPTPTRLAIGDQGSESPVSIVTADFDGDGKLDLAAVNSHDNNVSILLGNGDGTFKTAGSPAAGDWPAGLAVGDFNRDGIPDLAVVNETLIAGAQASTVSILLGNGDGTFTPMPISPTAGPYPVSIAIGDFNGDGNEDLAVGNSGDDTLTILLGNGNGTFTPAPLSPSTGGWPFTISVTDFNGDGNLDLAIANESSTVKLLLGNGDGTFSPAQTNPSTSAPVMVAAVGDFNGDGVPDLVGVQLGNKLAVIASNLTASATGSVGPMMIPGSGTHLIDAQYSGDSVNASSTSITVSVSGTPPAAAPTFSVTPGTYTSAQTVFISDATPGALIYYTTNGSTPTTSSTPYSSPITVSSSETIQAIATASGYSESPVASAAYTINLPAATPAFSVTPGTYTSTQSVAISDSTPGATIYYTANGSTPTTSSTPYSGPITVSSSETIEAIASGNGYSQSAVASATYTINLPAATPTFSATPGTYTAAQTVAISDSTPGAVIYYTTNGTTPTTSSTPSSSPITVSSSETIEAIATASGYSESTVASAAYTINLPAATPTFSVTPGTYTAAQTVAISDSTPGAVIYYTTNGTTPTTSSTPYSSPITVSSSETIEAIAAASGYSQSPIALASYTINLANPVPTITSLSPAYTVSAGSAFSLTVNGSGFMSGSTIYWGNTALATQFVRSTQLTAQVSASDIASAGTIAITVETPAPGGGISPAFQFEVDSANSASAAAPTFTATTATVSAGNTASYPVTPSSSVSAVTVNCLNLPAGASCSSSASSGAVSIMTSSNTPSGTYQVTVVFSETQAVSASFVLAPFLLLPLMFIRRKLRAKEAWITACLVILVTLGAMAAAGCGGGSSGSLPSQTGPTTEQVTSSGVVTLTVK